MDNGRDLGIGGVEVEGLVDLQQALRRIDKSLPRELGVVHRDVARRVVNKARANTLGPMEARAARYGLKARGEQRGAYVMLQSNDKSPFTFGAEFGADRNRMRRRRKPAGGLGSTHYVGYRQFAVWTGNSHSAGATDLPGYWLYPAVRSEGKAMVAEYLQRLEKLRDDNGL